MEKHRHVFEQMYDYETLYGGYLLARRGKRFKDQVLQYTSNLEENLIDAQNNLIWKSYEVGQAHQFYEYFPKKRIIYALPFADRVINCAAYNTLIPIYQKSYYEHSYGSIAGKGPIKAAKQLQYWIRLVGNKPEPWVLVKCDVAKFFFRIPFEVQMRELMRPIDDPQMEWFLDTALRGNGQAFGLPLDVVDVALCDRVAGIGMPVGSLLSQTTANVVMNRTDQFMKRELHVPYYMRYMDDMIFLVPRKAEAHEILRALSEFLQSELGLNLNNKTAIMKPDAGVEFVGKRIWPEKMELRRSTSLYMKRHLNYIREHYASGELDLDYATSVIRSYLGMMSHCNNDALIEKVLADYVLIRDSSVVEIPEIEGVFTR